MSPRRPTPRLAWIFTKSGGGNRWWSQKGWNVNNTPTFPPRHRQGGLHLWSENNPALPLLLSCRTAPSRHLEDSVPLLSSLSLGLRSQTHEKTTKIGSAVEVLIPRINITRFSVFSSNSEDGHISASNNSSDGGGGHGYARSRQSPGNRSATVRRGKESPQGPAPKTETRRSPEARRGALALGGAGSRIRRV